MITTRDVIEELKDVKAREFIEKMRKFNVPYKLNIRDPTEDSMKFVCNFAKDTGDFASLSATDLRLIALAYRYVIRRGEQKLFRNKPLEIKEFKPKKGKLA